MRLFLRYIAIIALVVVASGCSFDELVHEPSTGTSTDAVTVIGRITRFDEYDVATRGVKNESESILTSMAMAIFPVNEDGTALAGNCVYWQYTDNQAELLFTVDRGSNYTYDARYAMYVFTNMDMSEFGIGSTLEAMMAKVHNVEDLNIPKNGFPMMGSLGDTFSTTFDKDNQTFILSPTENGNLVAPKVNGTTQTLLTIPMKAMYAKVNFTIEVRPDQQIEGNYSSQFTLNSYTVNNIPSKVDFNNSTNSDTEVFTPTEPITITGNKVASGANKINFTFYLPERLLTPQYTSATYPKYPFVKDDNYSAQVDSDDNGYRDEDEKLFQRFKAKLLNDSQKATNVVISGRFRDHQNHYWDVDYTIHLGANNNDDFNILRNAEYNNIVTIRGIQTSNDMSNKNTPGSEAVSIDHRVNVERSQPAIISLRREVMLDSHFEIRPLRIRKSDIGDVAGINAVKVEVVNPITTNWMRLERSFGDGTPEGSPQTTVGGVVKSIYIDEDDSSPSFGKRRFFTYNLIDGVNADATDATLKESTSVILPLNETTECCWIYVDECTETGDDVRAGQIKVSYGNLSGTTFTPANNATYPDVTYIINQRKLFNVTGATGRTYNIEYSEEYLYNFDADDEYGQTEYNGMEWGLEGIQLSYDHEALYFKAKTGDWANGIVDYFTGAAPAYYDFYIKSHDQERMADPKQVTLHEYEGYNFCTEIIQTLNGGQVDDDNKPYDDDPSNNIDVLQLNEQPKSAIEYCYNKNKRNNKGQVAWTGNTDNLNWYLPAVDEIEDIVMSSYGGGLHTYARFLEFQEQDYWSCQPAFIQNYAHMSWTFIFWPLDYWGAFYYDDIGNTKFDINNNTDRAHIGSARSTSVSFTNTYESTPSGTNGYYSFYDADDQNNANKGYSYSGTFNGVTIGTISREPGNQPRNEKNRVRCVRKQ